jgi:hypothetical protein
MAGVIESFRAGFTTLWSPAHAQSVLLWVVVMAVAAAFIYIFYKSVSKRDLLSLNLRKHNYSEHPGASKFFGFVFFLLEYIIIIPILVILWFAGLSIVLLFIEKTRSLDEILLIAAAVIGATRVLAYYHSEISKDLAKMFPFIVLSVFLLSPGEFSATVIWEKVYEIPTLLGAIFSFVLVIILIEIVLRMIYSVVKFFKKDEIHLSKIPKDE